MAEEGWGSDCAGLLHVPRAPSSEDQRGHGRGFPWNSGTPAPPPPASAHAGVSRPKERRNPRREGPKGGGGEREKGQDEGGGWKSGLTGFCDPFSLGNKTKHGARVSVCGCLVTSSLRRTRGHVRSHPRYAWQPVKVQVEVSRKQLHVRVKIRLLASYSPWSSLLRLHLRDAC